MVAMHQGSGVRSDLHFEDADIGILKNLVV